MTGPNDRILPPRMVGPDRIFAGIGGMSTSTKTGERGLAGGWSEHSDHLNVEYNCTEYIRRDPAVLAALPEVQALIRQAVETALLSAWREFLTSAGLQDVEGDA